MTKTKDGLISTRIELPLQKRLQKLAKKLDRPVSWLIRMAIQDLLKKEKV